MTKDNAKTMGFVILAFNLIILLLAKSDFDPFSPMTIRMLFIISILIRIVSCIWVTIVASEINHTSGLWAVFALLFPAIALIVIGSTNSNYSTMTDENDSNEPLEIKHILVDYIKAKSEIKILHTSRGIDDIDASKMIFELDKDYLKKLAILKCDSLIINLESLKKSGVIDRSVFETKKKNLINDVFEGELKNYYQNDNKIIEIIALSKMGIQRTGAINMSKYIKEGDAIVIDKKTNGMKIVTKAEFEKILIENRYNYILIDFFDN